MGLSHSEPYRFAAHQKMGSAALNPSYKLLLFPPPPRLNHLAPLLLHDLQPFRGNVGECGHCVAADLVVKDQAVADQAQRFHDMRGVAERLLDAEQKRGQV
jgi:hypothetical protein